MALKDDLQEDVAKIFGSIWNERDGIVVPSDDSLRLGNDAIKLDGTVLYADLADSTALVDGYTPSFSAEIYKTFLHCAAKIIRNEGGVITAYDGDRIMAVFIGGVKNTAAVRAAMKVRWSVSNIIEPTRKKQYKTTKFDLCHTIGIDTSELYVAKTGVRGANDLVWVGRAANYAAKLASLPDGYTYVTEQVYNVMLEEAKLSNGTNMWTPVCWNTFDNRIIYRSSWWWTIS